METKIEKYVTFRTGVRFFPEDYNKGVDDYSLDGVSMPDDAWAYRFYTVERKVTQDGDERFEKVSKPFNVTGWHYIQAEIKTSDDLDPVEHFILLSNMRGNGWDKVVKCRFGNYQPFESNDVIATPTPPTESEVSE